MGWRENMKTGLKNEHSKPYIQKVQNIQKVEKKEKNKAFVPFAPFVVKNQKAKNLQDELAYLWDKAWKLADWIDDEHSTVHWKERKKYVPEVFKISARIGEIERQLDTGVEILPDGGKKYQGLNGVWYPLCEQID